MLEQERIRRDIVRTLRDAAKGAGFCSMWRRSCHASRNRCSWSGAARIASCLHKAGGSPSYDGQLVAILDSYRLIPLDQPAVLTRGMRDFVAAPGSAGH
jgi:hypothetical protein